MRIFPAIGIVPAVARAVAQVLRIRPQQRSWLNSLGYMGSYNSTDPSRTFLQGWFPRNATSDQTLTWNLTNLIAQLRQLARNNCAIKGLVTGWKADVVGTGIDVEPDTGDDKLNARIRTEWLHWAENVTPDGKSLWEMQAQAMDEWCCAGAHLWREITIADRANPDAPTGPRLPICFTPVEPEWLTLMPIGAIGPDDSFTRGIQCDSWGRPKAYHIMDYNLLNQSGLSVAWGGPGDVVPASQVIYGYEATRGRQIHGEPLLVAVIERCYQDGRLIDVELNSAVNTSAQAGVITSHDQQEWDATREVVDQYGNASISTYQQPVMNSPVANWWKLAPGESATAFNNTRPSQGIDPFRKGLRGDLAAGGRSSQDYLDRDSSRASYSSKNADQNLSQRIRFPVARIFARSVASQVYERVLPWILIKIGEPMPKNPDARRRMFQHRLMFDKPGYVDPVKDSAAAAFMIDHGLSTLEEECSNRGRDYRQVREQRRKEQSLADADTVSRIAAIQAELKKQGVQGIDWSQIVAIGGAATSPGSFLEGVASAMASGGEDEEPTTAKSSGKGKSNAA